MAQQTSASEQAIHNYEGIIIMHPDTSEEEQKNLFRKNKEIIAQFSGEINHLDTWGKRRLANPIQKLTRGVYFHTTFAAQGSCIAELERTMGINDKVLRFSHVRLDDRINLAKHVEAFKETLAATAQREKEREAKFQQKKAAMAARRTERHDRDFERDE